LKAKTDKAKIKHSFLFQVKQYCSLKPVI